jgi:aerobic-type carbon monoxide dehydrogenase small subunit (CoxS/CutS family)
LSSIGALDRNWLLAHTVIAVPWVQSAVATRSRGTVGAEPETPLLWVVREQLGLRGTKYGCGIGMCGIGTVHLDGKPHRRAFPVARAA